MTEKDFKADRISILPESGEYSWKSPSNIALVKYWGKKENQIPANPSISFTLDACATRTRLEYKKKGKPDEMIAFDLFFEGERKDTFKPKIQNFFTAVLPYCPYLTQYQFTIHTSNSFPHSSGIASSASGMSALALCVMSLEKAIFPKMEDDFFYKKASFLARLGSGSASRSIEGPVVSWGVHDGIENSSNLYGSKYKQEIHPVFEKFHDTILLVDKGEKTVSSTVGHGLMKNHPFAENRFHQAHHHMELLKGIFKNGDLNAFVKIVEREALTLHAMMMTSQPYFLLMKPNTLEIIQQIWEFRKKTGLHLCFTLDAGANVHILYPESEKTEIIQFIRDQLVVYCENGHYICDRIGFGSKKL